MTVYGRRHSLPLHTYVANDAIGFFNVLSTPRCSVIRRVTVALRTRRYIRAVYFCFTFAFILFTVEDGATNRSLLGASVITCDIGVNIFQNNN